MASDAAPEPILTVAQMRSAEQALIDAGTSVDALMQVAGRGAAEWVWRVAAGRSVTVLCGPGNNGGDGYVIAEVLRASGLAVRVIALCDPRTDAARNARALYQGEVLGTQAAAQGQVLVDCLFGSGLTRGLDADALTLLTTHAAAHTTRIAIDVPSGVESDSGARLNPELPAFDLTVALGAWKQAHVLMPACAAMGALRLVDIGIGPVAEAAFLIARPHLSAPAPDAHKYRRGYLGIVGGAMPGAAVLAATAAQGAGAGYVKLLADHGPVPADLVLDDNPLAEALFDPRWSALLCGPGLGRERQSRLRLDEVMALNYPLVLDADGLALLSPDHLERRKAPLIVTPHEGELAALERSFAMPDHGTKVDRARRLAAAIQAVVVAKGPDTVIAAPDGRTAFAPRASSWLSTAGTGDVLAGTIAARLAAGRDPFVAASEGVWLHGEAARLAGPAFSARQLAASMRSAYAACL